MNSNPEDPRPAVDPSDTVAPQINYNNRTATDKWWGIAYVLSYIGFLSTGFFLVSKARSRYDINSDGNRVISDYFLEDAEKCCGGAGGGEGPVCWNLDNYYGLEGDERRRLQSGNSKFDGDEGIFDAFLEAPEIIAGLLSLTIAVAIVWVVLLRFFAKPIVIIAEACKVAILIVLGIYQEVTSTKVLFFVLAGLVVVYVWWAWNKLMFAAKIISHSTIAMKENPSILTGALFVKLLFAANAALFVIFFAESFNVVEVRDAKTFYGDMYYVADNSNPYCFFTSPTYVGRINVYLSLSYLWTIVMLNHMRLSIVSTVVGSWHFHPEDKPGLLVAIKNIGPSFGTICVTSLVSTIAEKINRILLEKSNVWMWCSPLACIAAPIHILACCFGTAIKTFVSMLTKFCLILHVFTGHGMVNSAKSVFKILSRHFKGGFVTEVTSKGVLSLFSYAFSVGIAMLTWVWIDGRFDCNTLEYLKEDYMWILYIIVILFNVYYPVIGLYIMVIANKYLQDSERSTMENNGSNGNVENTNHLWIPPLAAAFVGCIAMMMMTLLSNIFLDIIDTLFLCFAIDRDNNVDMSNDEFTELIKEMPMYAETVISVDTDSDKGNSPEVVTAVPY